MIDWVNSRPGTMPEAEYSELEPLYQQAKAEVPLMERIAISTVQRRYMLGYNRAARLLEQLCSCGALQWNRVTGAYRARSAPVQSAGLGKLSARDVAYVTSATDEKPYGGKP